MPAGTGTTLVMVMGVYECVKGCHEQDALRSQNLLERFFSVFPVISVREILFFFFGATISAFNDLNGFTALDGFVPT